MRKTQTRRLKLKAFLGLELHKATIPLSSNNIKMQKKWQQKKIEDRCSTIDRHIASC
jgi:hypothetical protein